MRPAASAGIDDVGIDGDATDVEPNGVILQLQRQTPVGNVSGTLGTVQCGVISSGRTALVWSKCSTASNCDERLA